MISSDQRKVEITQQMMALTAELQQINNKEIIDLAQEAKNTKIDWLSFLADAFLHEKLRIKPAEPKFGYVIAKLYQTITENSERNRDKLSQEVFLIINKIVSRFDVPEYVFRHTHYDECSNGRFFRRS